MSLIGNRDSSTVLRCAVSYYHISCTDSRRLRPIDIGVKARNLGNATLPSLSSRV